MGVEVAGEGLDGGPPLVAGVAFVERLDLGDERFGPDQLDGAGAAQAVELDAVRPVGEGAVFRDVGERPDDLEVARARGEVVRIALGEGQDPPSATAWRSRGP